MSATLGGGLAEDLQSLMASCRAEGGGGGGGDGGDRDGGVGGGGGGGVPVVVSEGRSYPVTTVYLGAPREPRGASADAP
jgi:ATP-dependent helicase HrpB